MAGQADGEAHQGDGRLEVGRPRRGWAGENVVVQEASVAADAKRGAGGGGEGSEGRANGGGTGAVAGCPAGHAVAPDDDFGVVDGVAGLVAPGLEEGAGLGAGIAVEQLGEPDLAVAGFAVVAVGLGAIVNSLVIAAAVGGDVAGLAGMGVAEARWGEVLWMGWAECHGASGSPREREPSPTQ